MNVTVRRWPVLERVLIKGRKRESRRTSRPLEERRVRLDKFVSQKHGRRPTRALLVFPQLGGAFEFSLDGGHGIGPKMRDWLLDEADRKKLRKERDRWYPRKSGARVRVDGPVLRKRVNLKHYAVCEECGAVYGPDDELLEDEPKAHGIPVLAHEEELCREGAEYNVGLFIAHGLAALSGLRLVKGKTNATNPGASEKQRSPN